MKYKPYPKYKDSGVEWLGEIPEGWKCTRLRFLVKLNPSKTEISLNHPKEVSFLPMDNIGDDGSLRLDITRNWEEVESGYTYFAEGDVTYAIITPCFENGKGAQMIGLINKVGFGTTELCVLRPNRNCDGRWLWYNTISTPFRKLGESWMYGAGGQKRVPDNFTRDYYLSFPPITTQRAIAAFLDAETARIDSLIKDYEDLIELLKEKRQALISHAVTRGLSELVSPDDPEFGEWAKPVKLKDSGVEWIGEIPEGWEIKKLRFLLERNGLIRGPFGGDLKKEIFTSSGYKVYEQKNAIYGDIEIGDSFISPEKYKEMSRFQIRPGDFIMSCSGTVGRIYEIPKSAPQGIINQALLIMRLNDLIDTRFFSLVFISNFLINQILDNSQGGAIKNLVGMDIFTAISFPLPSIDEQKAIAIFLNRETSKLDTLVSESQSAIELLKEHRSALITNAVTGKINVENIA